MFVPIYKCNGAALTLLLVTATLGCTKPAGQLNSETKSPLPVVSSAQTDGQGRKSIYPAEQVDPCEYLRELRKTCYRGSEGFESFDQYTALSLAECAALPVVLTSPTLAAVQQCIRTVETTAQLVAGEPSYCTDNPVEDCVLHILESKIEPFGPTTPECRELRRVCGSQPVTLRTDICGAIETTIEQPFRRAMRACLSWYCDDISCSGQLLSLGRKAQTSSKQPPVSLENPSCAATYGVLKVVRSEALEIYGDCPPSYGSYHMFLWYLDEPPDGEFLDECQDLVKHCEARRLKVSRNDVPMNLTPRPCRTALWAARPEYRRSLKQCMASGCNAADCLYDLAVKYSK